jgi:hypothetical protein
MDFTTNLAQDERVSSLFQPDTLLPEQYLSTCRRKFHLAPENKLMLAILEDAIDCFQKFACARDKKRQALFLDAEHWIFKNDETDWLFSFENACEVVGLSPPYVRRELLRWKATAIARSRKKRLPRVGALAQPQLLV